MEIGKEEIKGQKTKGNYGMKKNKKGTTRTALDSNRYRTSAQPNPRTDNIPVSAIDNQKSITQRVSKKNLRRFAPPLAFIMTKQNQ